MIVAINQKLGETYVLRDMKKQDEDNSIMLNVSISQNELQVCKSIASYIMHKQVIYVSHLLFVILVHIFGKYLI